MFELQYEERFDIRVGQHVPRPVLVDDKALVRIGPMYALDNREGEVWFYSDRAIDLKILIYDAMREGTFLASFKVPVVALNQTEPAIEDPWRMRKVAERMAQAVTLYLTDHCKQPARPIKIEPELPPEA